MPAASSENKDKENPPRTYTVVQEGLVRSEEVSLTHHGTLPLQTVSQHCVWCAPSHAIVASFVCLPIGQKHARFPVKHAEGALGVRPAVRGRVFILLVDPPSPSFLEMVRKLKLGLN